MPPITSFDDTHLRAICNILGETSNGLTGSEIGKLLRGCGIEDIHPDITKRDRLYEALRARQKQDRYGNQVVAFVMAAMNPINYVNRKELFEERRAILNQALAFSALSLGDDGQIRTITVARTISQAEERAGKLRKELINRRVHADVLKFCRAELLQDNYFHAVFEATKSVTDKIRDKAGLIGDGSQLVDQAFGFGTTGIPLLALNSLQTETEQSEHRGLMNLLKGLFGTFRNTTAHAPKIRWSITEQDALDMLSLASLLHRRLDEAVKTR